ncbi:alpha/beta fold hydrolase [Granulicella sp. WH15]|uniref:alpha/beta fold hydrolase n=1 Tax=Granulicella sp. WH15 TaxID=2602070 RepID=UPI001366A209|nr:alpha/beta fold hydrolase [Granulicella sp. WH15]QHN05431.1 alpha/beta fold hydrolase [Granulicella sp. WH15]
MVEGMRVHYRRAGSGPALLLVHGLVGSAGNWNQNIDFLSKSATVYAVDLFNMGESERVPGLDASLEATADRLADCMDALGLADADVAGHSHGGAIVMMLAARHPERVRRLVLFAPANPFCDLGKQLISFYRTPVGGWFARRIPSLPRKLHATALSRMYGDPNRVAEGALEGYTNWLDATMVEHVLRIVRGWGEDMSSLLRVLDAVAVIPTLLIWGDRDRAVGLASAQRLRELLPEARLMVLPGVGHLPFAEQPEICNPAVRDWLRS